MEKEKNQMYQEVRTTMKERVRRLRKMHHLTQAQMGEQLNISRRTYANYERGIHAMPAEVLAEIAGLFHVTMDYLVGREL